MPLISSEPQTIGNMAARVAALEEKYVVVIDNTAYHSMTADEKTAMYNYYKSVDSNGDPQWIIPEAEIDEIFALKHIFYIFKTQQLAVDNCYDWFPQPQNVPDADHYIKAYVIRPNGTIPYENADPTPPG